jgi:hypothetical protein
MTRIIALEKEVKELRDHQMAIGLSIQESATEAFSATTVAPTAPSAAPAAPLVKPASFVKPVPSKEMEWTKVVKKQPRARNPASAPKLPPRSSNKNLSRKILPANRFAEAIYMQSRGGKGSDTLVDANDPFVLDPTKAAPVDKSKPATRCMEYFEIPAKVSIDEIKKALKTFDITPKDYETIRFIRSPTNSSVVLEFYASSWIKARLALFCEKIMGAKSLERFDPLYKNELASSHRGVQHAFHKTQAQTIGRILDRHMTQKCRTILHKLMQEHEIEITPVNQPPHSKDAALSARTTGQSSTVI